MHTYNIALTRVYEVEVTAENEPEAKRLVEFYIGNCADLADEAARREHRFNINNIELMVNEATSI